MMTASQKLLIFVLTIVCVHKHWKAEKIFWTGKKSIERRVEFISPMMQLQKSVQVGDRQAAPNLR